MALSLAQLAAAMRLTADASTDPPEPIAGILTRQLAAAQAIITEKTTGAPRDVQDQACILLVGYLYDMPTVSAGDRFMAAWRYSGAASLLASWTDRRTGISEVE